MQSELGVGYFIAYENLFSTWIEKGLKDSELRSRVSDALSAFTRNISPTEKKLFENIFITLQTGLSKLVGEAAISKLLHLINEIPMDSQQDYDVLGFIYEYLISNFAANAGKKAGEFYTPHEVSLLMSEIVAYHLRDRETIQIYDPTSGSGSLLINIGKCAARYMGEGDNILYYAQELKENTYNLTRMNLIMRGILPANISIRKGNTLKDDWPYFEEDDHVNTYTLLCVDAVVSNPPYSQHWDPKHKENDPRYSAYGLAPEGKADYAFLLHSLYHLESDGIMTIVLPHGVLFRGNEEGAIRKNLIEKNNIDAIIGLPANMFFGTGIPTIIMVLKKQRDNTDVLIIDASKGFIKEGEKNKLRACDIKRITDVVKERSSVEKFSKVVSQDEIRANDYNLNIPRYVDSSSKSENYDIFACMFGGIPDDELSDFKPYWDAFPDLKNALFISDNGSHYRLNIGGGYCNLKTAVYSHPSVLSFFSSYKSAFQTLNDELKEELISNMLTLNIAQEEAILSDTMLFPRLSEFPLIDRYHAYQLLDDEWVKIAADLEVIRTEDFNAIKKVDPNMVMKKKKGTEKEVEVQEGYKGHILPFELVQKVLLSEELSTLTKLKARLSEISGECEALLDELSEEDKEQDFINEDKNAFVLKKVKNAINDGREPETLLILKKAEALLTEEKDLKKQIKNSSAALNSRTKETIEKLSDDEARELLRQKWITPITESVLSLADKVVADFVGKLENLCKKYETTFSDNESEINETERSLTSLLGDLTGNETDIKGIAELKKLLAGE